MKVGVSQLCIPGTIDEVIAKTKQWGYDALELGMKKEGGVLNLATSPAELDAIKKKIADAGLMLTSIVAGPVPEYSLFDKDPAIRQKGIDTCKRVLDITAALGADTILLVLGRLVPETCYDEAVDLSIESLKKIAPHAKATGVHIGLEQVWNKFLVSPLDMKHVIESVNSSHVGVFLDTGNMVFWNYPEHWIKILAKHIKKVHFKDFGRDGMTLKFVPLREGEVNWPNVMRELRAAEYEGPVISEVSGDDAVMAKTALVMREIIAL